MVDLRVEPFGMIGGRNSNFWVKRFIPLEIVAFKNDQT